MLPSIRKLHSELQALKREVSIAETHQIGKKSLRNKAEDLGTRWFSEFADPLRSEIGLSTDIIEFYSKHFARLIKISGPSNLKKSYVDVLAAILKRFRDDLIIPLQTQTKRKAKTTLLADILKDLPSESESNYLHEATECAKHDFYRAAVVLGWCAAIDRIHRVIEKEGFKKFNVTSASIASQTKGRFKRFNAVQNISSINEIREVFDSVILWVIEGMQVIDSNQHTRLRSCFDMRCQCAHPGDAPVTEYNLLSYFSDLNEIVFKNDRFKVTDPGKT